MSKNPIVPTGYDQEELWAHEEDQKKIKALKEKEAAEKAKREEDAADDDDDKLHQRYYGDESDPDA